MADELVFQTLLTVTRDKESAIAQAEQLVQELAMYRSVAVAGGQKPKTTITRVSRQPLAVQNMNGQSAATGGAGKPSLLRSTKGALQKSSSYGTALGEHGDMTLDELS